MHLNIKKIPLSGIFFTLIIFGLFINCLCIYFLFNETHIYDIFHIKGYSPHTTTITLSALSTLVFSTLVLLSYKAIIRPYIEMNSNKEELIKTIQIPHNDPNPILQFSADGELIFANIAAYDYLQLNQGKETQNEFIKIVYEEISHIKKSRGVVKKEIHFNDKYYLAHITPIETLNTHYINVYAVDITKIKEYQHTLKDERETALQASRVKSEFLANMSHELRTPMNGIISLSELLNKQKLAPEPEEYAKTILSSAQTLLTILNDILDISKVESGELELEHRCFDLHSLLKDLQQLYAPIAKNKDIQLTLSIPENTPKLIKGDMGRITQILRNLVGNAIKFTKYGEVSIGVAFQNSYDENTPLTISVKDSGIGIKPEKIAQIFDKFTQADASVTREYGGTGLGLAICKELVNLMGGKISAISKEGFGSTFSFTLPYVKPEEGELPINTVQSDILNHDIIVHPDVSILAVDDTDMNLFCLEKILNDMGINIIDKATNGEEALSLMNSVPYDIVFMDCMMPILDGYQATQIFREHEHEISNRHQVIIAMTANAMAGDREKSLKSGMDDHISKPIHAEVIKTKLAAWLEDSKFDIVEEKSEEKNLSQQPSQSIVSAQKEIEIADNKEPINNLTAHKNIFNKEQLDMFCDHDRESEIEILSMFMQQSDIVLRTLSEQKQHPEWVNLVHKLKGISGNCGAVALYETCKNAEHAEDGEKEEWLNRIQQSYTTVTNLFKESYGPQAFDTHLNN